MSNYDNLNPRPENSEAHREELKRYESGVTAFLIAGLICLLLGIITIKALIGAGLVLLFLSYMWSRKAKELRGEDSEDSSEL